MYYEISYFFFFFERKTRSKIIVDNADANRGVRTRKPILHPRVARAAAVVARGRVRVARGAAIAAVEKAAADTRHDDFCRRPRDPSAVYARVIIIMDRYAQIVSTIIKKLSLLVFLHT